MTSSDTRTTMAPVRTDAVYSERQTFERAPEELRARFASHFSPVIWSCDWSLANLTGKAREYKGKYHQSMCRQLRLAMEDVGCVRFAYDAQRRGYKRPFIRVDDVPMWID